MTTQLTLFRTDNQNMYQKGGAILLKEFAVLQSSQLLAVLDTITRISPFRHMVTRRGYPLSVAMTNCGVLGWVTDEKGYRYTSFDPLTGQPWPLMPERFLHLATAAAQEAGFCGFYPNACLINLYEPGSKMALHQDKDEKDFTQPIVSLSLGLPATFLFGGRERKDPVHKIPLHHGDVIVWGGEARLAYHGISPLKKGEHPVVGAKRINLTFRKVEK